MPTPLLRASYATATVLLLATAAGCSGFSNLADTDTDTDTDTDASTSTTTGTQGGSSTSGTTNASGTGGASSATNATSTGTTGVSDTSGAETSGSSSPGSTTESGSSGSTTESGADTEGTDGSTGPGSDSTGADAVCDDFASAGPCLDSGTCLWDPADDSCFEDDGSNPCQPFGLVCLITDGCTVDGLACVPG